MGGTPVPLEDDCDEKDGIVGDDLAPAPLPAIFSAAAPPPRKASPAAAPAPVIPALIAAPATPPTIALAALAPVATILWIKSGPKTYVNAIQSGMKIKSTLHQM
jgi:hypothetical protein